jgi:hypothetical protein
MEFEAMATMTAPATDRASEHRNLVQQWFATWATGVQRCQNCGQRLDNNLPHGPCPDCDWYGDVDG